MTTPPSAWHWTGLDALQARLPDDAFEAPYLYAAGETYEALVRERGSP